VTTVWLARHGEVHNPGALLYGRLPRMRLTPEGLRQARALAEVLAQRPIEAVYSSPLLRARRTAEVIVGALPSVDRLRIDRDLLEIQSAWEGEPLSALEAIDWDLYSHPRADTDESLHHIHARMCRWLSRVLRRHAGAEVVGVSHGDPILILVGSLQGLPLDPQRIFPKPYIEPGTLYRLEFAADGTCCQVEQLVPHAAAA